MTTVRQDPHHFFLVFCSCTHAVLSEKSHCPANALAKALRLQASAWRLSVSDVLMLNSDLTSVGRPALCFLSQRIISTSIARHSKLSGECEMQFFFFFFLDDTQKGQNLLAVREGSVFEHIKHMIASTIATLSNNF